jgi:hypothetical protein
MTDLIPVKCLTGWNFVRPDRVIALQTSQTGATLIVMEGGASINSIEFPTVIADRLAAAERNEALSYSDDAGPLRRAS